MIYLVRHGQTEFNAQGRFQGQVDSPLTARGKDQARQIGGMLRRLIEPDHAIVFASPLGRTKQTAHILAEAAGIRQEIVFDPGLMEIGMGCWEGLTNSEIEANWPDARSGFSRNEWYFHSPDGERYEAFSDRLEGALHRVTSHSCTSRIIVSHGVASRVLRGLYANLPRDEALSLETPQDAMFQLTEGQINRIACD
ncbi:histidine phosphatase family protein [Beijerinckia indica]|uniref:Phosphoglycerate mutase n=1 Tax=Beijerinckia indica subsp. indica (strain ATCC 9039 / DSM 1715 / NCIMB 8712) TaxID=395963 RepID=B2IKL5_BEII9|nr:histidine phosphatase family protein [Beijerinckia indica]ACB95054.1 Phosphoglycerate mutase [Beijerinckia indica subsp. indica ATCC 9039]